MEDSMEKKFNCRDKIYTPIKSNKRNYDYEGIYQK